MSNFNSAAYWESRYVHGGTSGAGSFGRLADYKARFINRFAALNAVHTVLEIGCGDGNQLDKLEFKSYLGIDVAPKAIEMCEERIGGKCGFRFLLATRLAEANECQLGLSLDVLYHLVEDEVFEQYLRTLFLLSTRYVVIYSSDGDLPSLALHVRHRHVSAYIAERFPEWCLVARLPNRYSFDPVSPEQTSFADFMVFKPRDDTGEVLIAV